MNFEQARFNMIEQQLRPANVLDAAVIELLFAVRREDFVPAAWRNAAFADVEIPLGHGACMLRPLVEALALQAVGLRKHEKVLEVGTGSGYMAALLASHADSVVSMEIVPELAQRARENLAHAGIANVAVETGDGILGMPAQAPFDVIMLSGSVAYVPRELLAQLKPGGRLFAIVGTEPAMTATLLTREGEGAFRSVGLFETAAAPLINAPAAPAFVF